jgi:hypothetical protein
MGFHAPAPEQFPLIVKRYVYGILPDQIEMKEVKEEEKSHAPERKAAKVHL